MEKNHEKPKINVRGYRSGHAFTGVSRAFFCHLGLDLDKCSFELDAFSLKAC
jgi:hypothetical protein